MKDTSSTATQATPKINQPLGGYKWWHQLQRHVDAIKDRQPGVELKHFLLSSHGFGYRLRGFYRCGKKEVEIDAIADSIRDLPRMLTQKVLRSKTVSQRIGKSAPKTSTLKKSGRRSASK